MKKIKICIIFFMMFSALFLGGCEDKDTGSKISKPHYDTQQETEAAPDAKEAFKKEILFNNNEASLNNSSENSTAFSDNNTASSDIYSSDAIVKSESSETEQNNTQSASSAMSSVDWESDEVWGPKG